MEQDFEIGGIIVDECVPYSLEYYLGVKAEGEDEDFEEDDEDDDDDGKDEGKDDSEDEPPKKINQKAKATSQLLVLVRQPLGIKNPNVNNND